MPPITTNKPLPLPSWFRQNIPDITKVRKIKNLVRTSSLHTVCESARCPNLGQCWEQGIATFMILGEICTRACRFCAVKSGRPLEVDLHEPHHTALAIKELNLKYVVITSVARDDLPDEGVDQFVRTIHAIRALTPQTKIEVLIPDFSNKMHLLKKLTDARPEVISHNLETVKRLSPDVRSKADYARSLAVLKTCHQLAPASIIKSGFMVGFGETYAEILQLMQDLHETGCSMLTIGQYLAPSTSRRHFKVTRFITPKEFEEYRTIGLNMGFKHVQSSPLTRSSFIAEKGYQKCLSTQK